MGGRCGAAQGKETVSTPPPAKRLSPRRRAVPGSPPRFDRRGRRLPPRLRGLRRTPARRRGTPPRPRCRANAAAPAPSSPGPPPDPPPGPSLHLPHGSPRTPGTRRRPAHVSSNPARAQGAVLAVVVRCGADAHGLTPAAPMQARRPPPVAAALPAGLSRPALDGYGSSPGVQSRKMRGFERWSDRPHIETMQALDHGERP